MIFNQPKINFSINLKKLRNFKINTRRQFNMFEVLGREITKTPIEEKGVLARIVKIDLLDISAKQFEITIELISGSHKGTLICDNKFHIGQKNIIKRLLVILC